jgi:hypothetical protein
MTKAIETAVKILESLPESTQENLVEELHRMALEAQDEVQWDLKFSETTGLRAFAQKARREIAEGKGVAMDFEQL